MTLTAFEKIPTLNAIRGVAAGGQHSLAVSAFGKLYVWGLGALGQLGLGRRATGRLAPVPLRLPENAQAARVSAGANHSLTLDALGGAWFFGHAEYGAHGALGAANNDYVDSDYYATPRRVKRTGPIARVASGSAFVVAADASGAVVTWGWPAHGVLARGGGGVAVQDPSPQRVPGLAGCVGVAAGGRHAAAIIDDGRSEVARSFYRPWLDEDDSGDVLITIEGSDEPPVRAHALVLAARSNYLRGQLRAGGGHELILPGAFDNGASLGPRMLRSVLAYLYGDRVEAPPHRLKALALVADGLHLGELSGLCRWKAGDTSERPSSTFDADLAGAVGSSNVGADVVLRLAGGETVPAHRRVLEHSDFLAAMLRFEDLKRGDASDDDRDLKAGDGAATVDWPHAADDAKRVLAYLYGGANAVDLAEDPSATMNLMLTADVMSLPRLVRLCESALVNGIGDDAQNARHVLAFADHCSGGAQRLRRAARNVLGEALLPRVQAVVRARRARK